MDATIDRSRQGWVCKCDQGARWCAIVLGFSIPVSTALDNFLLFGCLVLGALGGHLRQWLLLLRGTPAGATIAILVAVHALGVFYTVAGPHDTLKSLSRALGLLLLVALIPILSDRAIRERALLGFLLAEGLTLVISYLIWLQIVPVAWWHKGEPADPVVFKLHITHNFLMAFATLIFALRARAADNGRSRAVYLLLAATAAVNVLVLVGGRTGHLVLAVFLVYLALTMTPHHWVRRAFAAATVVLAMGLAGWLLPGSALHQRAAKALEQLHEYHPGDAGYDPVSGAPNSMVLRLEFWHHSLAIIREHPLFGVGTGGFPQAYADRVRPLGRLPTSNPLNEYLMITVELGVIGLAAYIAMLIVLLRAAERIPERTGRDLARCLVIAYGIASLVSSTLLDHTERVFFIWLGAIAIAQIPGLAKRGA